MREQWEDNRELKRRPKRGKHWCNGCDANLIWDGQKCKVCGSRDVRKRSKK